MIIITKEIYKDIYKIIKSYDEIVIARHIGPDPDAVTSQIALRDSIRLSFPNKKVFAVGASVSKFKYIGYLDRPDYNSLTNVLLIVLDVPNMFRVDGIEGLNYKAILKIDHHPSEDIKGDVDFTSSSYSSTAEMVADVLDNTRLKMDEKIAANLYMGIISDSERFLFKNTQVHTFEVVLNLLKKHKFDFVSLYDHLYQKSLNECKFEAYITNNLIVTENNLAYINISPEVLTEFGVDVSVPSIIINNYNFIKELLVWTFITYDEKNEVYKVSIRSRGPVINEIASHFHGGGHNYAAGARIYEKEDIDKFLSELDNACKDYLKECENAKTN